MSRIGIASQCRAIKPPEPTDTKVIHCVRAQGHVGRGSPYHSAGRLGRWLGTYSRRRRKT